jgi:hypothetical protein
METLTSVVLILTIVTGAGRPNITHREPMPDLESCLEEAGSFLSHNVPDFVDAKGLGAGCSIPQNQGFPL